MNYFAGIFFRNFVEIFSRNKFHKNSVFLIIAAIIINISKTFVLIHSFIYSSIAVLVRKH